MSGEFRWCGGGYLWQVLDNLDEDGRELPHPVTVTMTKLYRALQPVEKWCAYYEACDSSYSEPLVVLSQEMGAITECYKELQAHVATYNDIARRAIEEAQSRAKTGHEGVEK